MVNSLGHGDPGIRTSNTLKIGVGIHTVSTPNLQSPNSFQVEAKDRPSFLNIK